MRQRSKKQKTKNRQNVKKLRRQKQLWERFDHLVIFTVAALGFSCVCVSFFFLDLISLRQFSPQRGVQRGGELSQSG